MKDSYRNLAGLAGHQAWQQQVTGGAELLDLNLEQLPLVHHRLHKFTKLSLNTRNGKHDLGTSKYLGIRIWSGSAADA